MGSLSGGISRYFRRRKYRRLHLDGRRSGGGCGPSTRRMGKGRFWRIRMVPKIVVRAIWSPSVKVLARLRNAYIKAMINVVGNNGALSTGNAFGVKRIPKARGESSPVIYSYNEVENRIVLEIFKALKAHQP